MFFLLPTFITNLDKDSLTNVRMFLMTHSIKQLVVKSAEFYKIIQKSVVWKT